MKYTVGLMMMKFFIVLMHLSIGAPFANSNLTDYPFGKTIKDITVKIENNIYEGIGSLTLMKFAIFGFVVVLFMIHFCARKKLRNNSNSEV